MTASVAHELNQPLTAIANNAAAGRRFLERGNLDPGLFQELLQDMVADSQRAAEVIRGIRALVRKDTNVTRSVLNLNALIAGTITAENAPERGACFTFHLPAVRGDSKSQAA